jgi:cytochrome c oxidase assembly protein subunit 16
LSDSSNADAAKEYYKNKAKARKNLFLKAGVPLILLVISGSLLLSNFLETQVEMRDKNKKSTTQKQFDLEEEHRKLMKNLDIDNFTLSRIPRPEELAENEKAGKGKGSK